ncbi:hypothetical protein FKM82_007313 [Ascaphus truei]
MLQYNSPTRNITVFMQKKDIKFLSGVAGDSLPESLCSSFSKPKTLVPGIRLCPACSNLYPGWESQLNPAGLFPAVQGSRTTRVSILLGETSSSAQGHFLPF